MEKFMHYSQGLLIFMTALSLLKCITSVLFPLKILTVLLEYMFFHSLWYLLLCKKYFCYIIKLDFENALSFHPLVP